MSDTEKPDTFGHTEAQEAPDTQDSESGLSAREIVFCDHLASGETSCQAAKAAGVCERTARRWRQRPEIQAAVRSRLHDALASARAILAQGTARAARSLVDLSDTGTVGDAAKVSASRAVIETSLKLTELEQLEARLAEVERQLATQTNRFPSYRS